jgi:trigger factor
MFMMRTCVKKGVALALALTTALGLAACNTKLKISYDYDAEDYVTVEKYRGIEIDLDVTSIRDNLVNQKIENDLESVTDYSEVTREAQDYDKLTLSFTGSIGGSTVDGFSSDEYEIILGEDDFVIPGFTDALYGMKGGESKVVTLTVPEGIQDADAYANKRIVYEITVIKVEQPIVPMVTDAYAQENFGYATLDEYKQSIIDDIQDTIDEQVESERKDAILLKLQDYATMKDYPEDLLNQKTEDLNYSINFYALMKSQTVDEYCQAQFGISFDEYVKRSVEQELILRVVAQRENLYVTEYEYKGDLEEFAKSNGFSDVDNFVEKYGKEKIAKGMLLQKAQNLILESAIVNEK